MKIKQLVVSIVLLSVILLVASCAGQAPAPAPAPSPAPTPAPAPAGPKLMKFASDIPEGGAISGGWIWYLNEIEKQTGGKVKWDRYWGGSLFKQAEQIDAIIAGVSDITNTNAMSRRQVFPVTHVFCLPSTSFPDTKEGHKAQREAVLSLIQKYPALGNEYKDFKLLTWNTDPARILIADKPVKVPDDIKGVKTGSEGTGQDIVKAAGGVPVMIIPPETYTAMQNKVINASMAVAWNHVQVFKLWEVANNYVSYEFGQGATNLYMNNKSWASLPPDVQKVMTDLLPECMARCDEGLIGFAENAKKSVLANKGTIYTPTAAEAELWEKAKLPTEQQWLDEMKAKGVTSAPDILKEVKQLRDKALGK